MGGDVSHEFLVPAEIGEDTVDVNGVETPAIEFLLDRLKGTKTNNEFFDAMKRASRSEDRHSFFEGQELLVGSATDDGVSIFISEYVAEVRQKAEADLAKLQILHRERMAALSDPLEARRAEEEYAIDRRRLEERRDSAIARLRDG